MMKHHIFVLALAAHSFAFAQSDIPLDANGVIRNETLSANQDIANAQAVGVITTFMGQGAQSCDANGENCHSLFGSDDSVDFTSLQANSQALTGIQSFSFDNQGDSNTISAQTGTLALACGDSAVQKTAGIAFKLTNCTVNAQGDAQITYQVCSAPSRSNPVTNPENAVPCSNDPADPSFRAPLGKVCYRPACDTEPLDSLNGWSSPQTVSWQAALPPSATESQKTNNGLGLTFYPKLGATSVKDFSADSDNMTAVKVVQSFLNTETGKTAVGLRVAYRHKAVVTKDMMTQGPASVPNPGEYTAQWDTILKLQGNALIPQYQAKYAKNGTECLQQITNGLSTDGVVSVCDQEYTNESGIKPIDLTAQFATGGQECGTTAQCLQEVVNTNTWTQTCRTDVPLSMRTCSTTTDYTSETIVSTRTRKTEICREERLEMVNSCVTRAYVHQCTQSQNNCASGGIIPGSASINNGSYSFTFDGQNLTLRNEVTAKGWMTTADFNFSILGLERVTQFQINAIHSDNWVGIRVNGQYVATHARRIGFQTYPNTDRLGIENHCTEEWYEDWGQGDGGSYSSGYRTVCNYEVAYGPGKYDSLEQGTNWYSDVYLDLRPYLKEGNNVITMYVINGGGAGYGRIYMSAFQQCPRECDIRVLNECSAYEAAH